VNKLRYLLQQADFDDIKSENIQVTFEFNSAEDYVRFTQEIAAPVNMMLANQTAEKKAKLWSLVAEKVKSEYSKDNGKVILDNEAICVVANCNKVKL
jgi:hypothetical protein